jgi:hypothetical protein
MHKNSLKGILQFNKVLKLSGAICYWKYRVSQDYTAQLIPESWKFKTKTLVNKLFIDFSASEINYEVCVM